MQQVPRPLESSLVTYCVACDISRLQHSHSLVPRNGLQFKGGLCRVNDYLNHPLSVDNLIKIRTEINK